MTWDADCARLVGQRAGDRLTDPPSCVGRKLEALAVVELLGRADEPECALLDQVEERQALVAVVLRDRNDEAQVRLDHLVLGVKVATFDLLRQVNLFLGGQQANLADVLEEELQRIGRHVRTQVDRGLGAAAATLIRCALDLSRRRRRIVVDQFDLLAFDPGLELFAIRIIKVELGGGAGDVGVREHSGLRAAGDKRLDLV